MSLKHDKARPVERTTISSHMTPDCPGFTELCRIALQGEVPEGRITQHIISEQCIFCNRVLSAIRRSVSESRSLESIFSRIANS